MLVLNSIIIAHAEKRTSIASYDFRFYADYMIGALLLCVVWEQTRWNNQLFCYDLIDRTSFVFRIRLTDW